ncbi:unnamed protein product [Amoebophrya sp. A25]|nr:unnamed protein product [Amoebophrya sp. A25]|eukprot:GSA25T00006897001.1
MSSLTRWSKSFRNNKMGLVLLLSFGSVCVVEALRPGRSSSGKSRQRSPFAPGPSLIVGPGDLSYMSGAPVLGLLAPRVNESSGRPVEDTDPDEKRRSTAFDLAIKDAEDMPICGPADLHTQATLLAALKEAKVEEEARRKEEEKQMKERKRKEAKARELGWRRFRASQELREQAAEQQKLEAEQAKKEAERAEKEAEQAEKEAEQAEKEAQAEQKLGAEEAAQAKHEVPQKVLGDAYASCSFLSMPSFWGCSTPPSDLQAEIRAPSSREQASSSNERVLMSL